MPVSGPTKISALTALTTLAADDLLAVVDVSEAADADKNKRITIQNLFASPQPIGATTPAAGAFTTLDASGAVTFADTMDVTGVVTLASTLDVTGAITGASIAVGATGLTVGSSVPFSDAAGVLTLQNVDALDATTEATIEAAIDTLANLTSIQGQTVSLSGPLTVEAASLINQDLTTDATGVQFGGLESTPIGGTTPAAGAFTTLDASGAVTFADTMDVTGVVTLASTLDVTGAITGASIAVGGSGLTVGSSVPFSDAAGVLTLQNVDALDATTEATIEAAIDTLDNLASIQGQTVSLSGPLTVESASVINQDLTTDATGVQFGAVTINTTIDIPDTSDSTSGVITKDGTHFIHNFNYGDNGTVTTAGNNIFIGKNAGNFTMGSTATYSSHASYNVGIGSNCLLSNTTGQHNVALGSNCLLSNTTGLHNVALGYNALYGNTSSYSNVAIGSEALKTNTVGNSNTAVGRISMWNNSSGYGNTAVGELSLQGNTTGINNVGIGESAGGYIADNTTSNSTSNSSVYIGAYTKASANGVTNENVFGYNATGAGSNTLVLGNDSIVTTFLKGNVLIGATSAGTSAAKVLGIAVGTAPTSSPVDMIQLYAEDVSASAELKVRDEAGNVTTLSPHNFTLFQPKLEYEFPWSYYSRNAFIGLEINVDMFGAIRAVERLTGEQFIYLNEIPRDDWHANQQAIKAARDKEIADMKKQIKVLKDAIKDLKAEHGPDAPEIKEKQQALDGVTVPPAYKIKPPPRYIAARAARTQRRAR